MGRNRDACDRWKKELTNDPEGLGYAGLSVEEIWDLVTAKTQEEPDSARKTARDIIPQVESNDEFDAIMATLAAAAETSASARIASDALDDYGQNGGLDFSHPRTIETIDAISFTAEQRTVLKSLGVRLVTRVSQIGVPAKRYHLQRAYDELEAE